MKRVSFNVARALAEQPGAECEERSSDGDITPVDAEEMTRQGNYTVTLGDEQVSYTARPQRDQKEKEKDKKRGDDYRVIAEMGRLLRESQEMTIGAHRRLDELSSKQAAFMVDNIEAFSQLRAGLVAIQQPVSAAMQVIERMSQSPLAAQVAPAVAHLVIALCAKYAEAVVGDGDRQTVEARVIDNG